MSYHGEKGNVEGIAEANEAVWIWNMKFEMWVSLYY
jgi:hypothetical protein